MTWELPCPGAGGIGGSGKTTLDARLAGQLALSFELVYWRMSAEGNALNGLAQGAEWCRRDSFFRLHASECGKRPASQLFQVVSADGHVRDQHSTASEACRGEGSRSGQV